MKRDENHLKMRSKVKQLLDNSFSDEEISKGLNLEIGTRYLQGTVRWYRFCLSKEKIVLIGMRAAGLILIRKGLFASFL